MTPAERLQAAIEKLEVLRSIAVGTWTAHRDEDRLEWQVFSSEYGPILGTGYVGNNDSEPHAELIATLHRTVDPQLAILREAENRVILAELHGVELAMTPGSTLGRELALADAILGAPAEGVAA